MWYKGGMSLSDYWYMSGIITEISLLVYSCDQSQTTDICLVYSRDQCFRLLVYSWVQSH